MTLIQQKSTRVLDFKKYPFHEHREMIIAYKSDSWNALCFMYHFGLYVKSFVGKSVQNELCFKIYYLTLNSVISVLVARKHFEFVLCVC